MTMNTKRLINTLKMIYSEIRHDDNMAESILFELIKELESGDKCRRIWLNLLDEDIAFSKNQQHGKGEQNENL